MIPFALSFVDEPKETNERERDPALLDKLKAEAPGILSWLVKGALRSQAENLKIPEMVKAAIHEYRDEEDILGHFIEECCTLYPTQQAKASDLYKAYQEWCMQSGYRAMGRKKFGQKLGLRFKRVSGRDCNMYQGLYVARSTTSCNHTSSDNTYFEYLE